MSLNGQVVSEHSRLFVYQRVGDGHRFWWWFQARSITTSGANQSGYRPSAVLVSLQNRLIPRRAGNTPPTVALALSVNGSPVTGPDISGSTLTATATASDGDGISFAHREIKRG